MSGDLKAAFERLKASHLIDTVHRKLKRWRAWFPSEESEVEVPRADLLALVAIADRAIKDAEHPERAAINLLAESANNLPDDWTIELTLTNDETSLSLRNPDGDDVEYEQGGECSFRDAICTAKDEEGQKGGGDER